MHWKFVSVLIIAATAGWMAFKSQRSTAAGLRSEIVTLLESKKNLVQPLAENRRLKALEAPSSELKRLDEDEATAARLRHEIEVGSETMRAKMKNLSSMTLTAPGWSNLGTATSGAAVETILWAAAGGDIDRLVDLMVFAPEAQAKAADLYAGLSASARARYASPEHLIANFTARDVPLTAVSFTGSVGGSDKKSVEIFFSDETGNPTMKYIRLNMILSPDGWRLTVPVSAVEKYSAMLEAGETPAAGIR